MQKRTKRTIRILAATAVVAVIGCATVKQIGQAYGGKTGQYITGAAEMGEGLAPVDKVTADKYGRSVAIAATNNYTLSPSQPLQVYVNYIGQTLAASSKKPNDHYIFGVLDKDDEVGAFSGPNGYIFITSGTLKKAQ